jgi:hypothetical protein
MDETEKEKAAQQPESNEQNPDQIIDDVVQDTPMQDVQKD